MKTYIIPRYHEHRKNYSILPKSLNETNDAIIQIYLYLLMFQHNYKQILMI